MQARAIMKGTTTSVIAVFVLSLGIWTAYSLTSYPLDAGSTVVVVGVVGLVVAGIQWIISILRKRADKDVKHD